MKTLAVQDFLRSYRSADEALAALTNQHGIEVKRDGDLAILNYGITETASDITDDCRALILEVPSFGVVSFSFRRFFNHNQGRAAKIDWDTAEAQAKLDGTLIVFYNRSGIWRVQTRSCINAEGETPVGGLTFGDRVRGVVRGHGHNIESLFAPFDSNLCFVCEYVGPYNRIVTRYSAEQLHLLAVTDRASLQEVEIPVGRLPFPRPASFRVAGGLESVVGEAAKLPKLDEGYVVVDGKRNRIKVKNPAYLAIAHAINAGGICSSRNFAKLAIGGDTAEVKAEFPELSAEIERMELVLGRVKQEAVGLWDANKDAQSRKDFALAVKHAKLSAWLFQRHSNKAGDIDLWVRENLREDNLVEWATP